MKAVRITGRGGSEVLELGEVPDPSPSHGQAMVRVRASAINRADLLQCLGQYPAPPGAPADIPGLEYAGEVVALGAGALDLIVGQRVMGIVSGGGFSERLVVHERECVKIPADLDFTEAGGKLEGADPDRVTTPTVHFITLQRVLDGSGVFRLKTYSRL